MHVHHPRPPEHSKALPAPFEDRVHVTVAVHYRDTGPCLPLEKALFEETS